LPSYHLELWRTAVKDWKPFWSAPKVITTLLGWLIGFLVSAGVTGLHSVISFTQAVLISLLSGAVAMALTMLLSLVKAPKLLHEEQKGTIKDRDRQVQERDEENQALREKSVRQIAFDFHLEVDTRETTRRTMPTPQPGNPIDVEIPVVYLVVANRDQRYIEAVRYRLNDSQWIKIGRAVPPNAPYKLDITERTVEYLTGSSYPQSPGLVHSELSITIECLGDGDPTRPICRMKRFVVDIGRTRARNNMAGLMINIQPE
jgi:hypothetical protein